MSRRIDTAALANKQPGGLNYYCRPWEEHPPPWPANRTRRPGQTGSARIGGLESSWEPADDNTDTRAAQRAAAEELFAPARAA